MRKIVVILFFILSIIFFGISLKKTFSTPVLQPGDMVSCSNFFKYCTDGGCVQSDRTFAVRCKIRNCANGCREYKSGKCIKWNYWGVPVQCEGGTLPGMGKTMCEPLALISLGICLPINQN